MGMNKVKGEGGGVGRMHGKRKRAKGKGRV